MIDNKYFSIKEASKLPQCPYSEYTLRQMLKRGELPGFYSGAKFKVNLLLLMEQTEAESRSRMKKFQTSK